jgi:hypothetical protein
MALVSKIVGHLATAPARMTFGEPSQFVPDLQIIGFPGRVAIGAAV